MSPPLAAGGAKRHTYLVLGDTKLTMHLSLNNVNVQRIRWQWSWSVRWGRRAVRRRALWPCWSIMWPSAPLELPAAPLCLRPTFLLWHTALAPHLIYTLAGEQVNAENPAKKNLCHSPSLKYFIAVAQKEIIGFQTPPTHTHLICEIFVYLYLSIIKVKSNACMMRVNISHVWLHLLF